MKPLNKYEGAMDAECVKLCDALNGMPGIMTFDSCSGHGIEPFKISFTAASLDALFLVVAKVASFGEWHIEATLGDGGELEFKLIGGKGEKAYEDTHDLIHKIESDWGNGK